MIFRNFNEIFGKNVTYDLCDLYPWLLLDLETTPKSVCKRETFGQ